MWGVAGSRWWGGQLLADILGGRTERTEVAQSLQFRMLALQCSNALLGMVVDDSNHQRGVVVVPSTVVPCACGVIHQPDPERVEVSHQHVRLRAVGVEWEVLQHKSRADLIDVEEVHGQLFASLCFLDPQQRAVVRVGDSAQATKLVGTSPGQLPPRRDDLGIDGVGFGHGKHPPGAVGPCCLQRFQSLRVTDDHWDAEAATQLDARIVRVQLDYDRADPRLPKVAKKRCADIFAEAADHNMSAHRGDFQLLQSIPKQKSQGTDSRPAGYGRREKASDLQHPREPHDVAVLQLEVFEAYVDGVPVVFVFVWKFLQQHFPCPDAAEDEDRDGGDTQDPPLILAQQRH